MTQEDLNQLLLIDLCARLMYELKVNVTLFNKNKLCVITGVSLNRSTGLYSIEIREPNRGLQHVQWPINIIKPYLRPMSSMTEGERKEYNEVVKNTIDFYNCPASEKTCLFIIPIDWLNKHYFDYRDLIGKGLALETPKGMYKID